MPLQSTRKTRVGVTEFLAGLPAFSCLASVEKAFCRLPHLVHSALLIGGGRCVYGPRTGAPKLGNESTDAKSRRQRRF